MAVQAPLLESRSTRGMKPGKWGRVFLMLFLLASLAGLIFFFSRPRLPYGEKDYQKALMAGDHERIVLIYDALRAKGADLGKGDLSGRKGDLKREADRLVSLMEEEAGREGERLIAALLAGGKLSEEDIRWLDLYAGMAGQSLDRAVRARLAAYLDGHLEEEAFRHFVGQLDQVAQLAREYRGLARGLDRVKKVREGLARAEEAALDQEYYGEARALEELLAAVDLTGLEGVRSYLEDRLEKAWMAYYKEEMPLIRQEMARERTYDAQARIRRLLPHFDQDEELLAFESICLERNPEFVISWWDPVDHLALKPLIADSQRAFDGDKFQEAADRDLLLTGEFEKMLEDLYQADYVLVDGASFVSDSGALKPINCPRGKKPLVLVLEDFYSSLPRSESGMAWRLDVDGEGQILGVLLDADGSERSDSSYTAIGILESFIDRHPDFSFNGARGVIALVGQYGLLGYPVADVQDLALRRNARESDLDPDLIPRTDFAYNRQKLAGVLEALEARNWQMASGTYSRLSLSFSSPSMIKRDLAMMELWVEPYTGKLKDLYCPFGDHVEGDPAKTGIYREAGYRLQSGYGAWPYWKAGGGYVYISRTFVSGSALRRPVEGNLGRYFDAGRILDRAARP